MVHMDENLTNDFFREIRCVLAKHFTTRTSEHVTEEEYITDLDRGMKKLVNVFERGEYG